MKRKAIVALADNTAVIAPLAAVPAPKYQPGDILLVRDYTGGSDLIGNLIMAGQRARYGNVDQARWTHSALIVSETGDLVEALKEGVRQTNIAKYANVETLIITPPTATATARELAVQGALLMIGESYGVLDFISLALRLLIGWSLSFHLDRQPICSEGVGRLTEKYVPLYPYALEDLMPADFGFYYKAFSGQPLPPLDFFGRLLDKVHAIAFALSPFTKGLRP